MRETEDDPVKVLEDDDDADCDCVTVLVWEGDCDWLPLAMVRVASREGESVGVMLRAVTLGSSEAVTVDDKDVDGDTVRVYELDNEDVLVSVPSSDAVRVCVGDRAVTD